MLPIIIRAPLVVLEVLGHQTSSSQQVLSAVDQGVRRTDPSLDLILEVQILKTFNQVHNFMTFSQISILKHTHAILPFH